MQVEQYEINGFAIDTFNQHGPRSWQETRDVSFVLTY